MKLNFFAFIRTSIFGKLFFIFFLTSLAVLLVICGAIATGLDPNQVLGRNIRRHGVQYAKYLVADLGTTPDIEKAQDLAGRLGIHLGIESPGGDWASSEFAPSIQELERLGHVAQASVDDPTVRTGRFSNRWFLVLERSPYRFLLFLRNDPLFENILPLTVGLVVLIGFILFGSYLWVRGIFRPIQSLETAAGEIARGNVDCEVPVLSSDELGSLATSFNRMAKRIREMITAKEQLLLDVS